MPETIVIHLPLTIIIDLVQVQEEEVAKDGLHTLVGT